MFKGISLPGRSGSQKTTIVLGNTNLRILATSKNSVTAWADIPFNPNLMRGDSVADPSGMGQVIRNAMARPGFGAGKKGKVISAMPGSHSIARMIPLPKARDVKPEEFIPRQARRLMGEALVDNSHLHWKLIKEEGAQDTYYVLAVPKNTIESFVETMRFAQVEPAALELTEFAMARAINVDNAVIAEADTQTVHIIIVADYIPTFMVHSIPESSIFSAEDAASVLQEELERRLSYYNGLNPDKPLADTVPIYVLGPYGGDLHVNTVLSGALGHPVMEMKPPSWLSYPQDFPCNSFAANLGLLQKENR